MHGAPPFLPRDSQGGKAYFATTVVNRKLKGLYNRECGIIVTPSAARLLCSFYADFVSWDAGCQQRGLADPYGWHVALRPSKPRNTPYPPEGLIDMMKMSQELQEGKGKPAAANSTDSNLAQRGNGEPGNKNGFWLGGYNEVLISSSAYKSGIPWSIIGVFFVNGGDKDGPRCAKATVNALQKYHGVANTSHILLLSHTPGDQHAFQEWP